MVVNGEQLVRGQLDPQGRSCERLRLEPIEVEFCDAIVAGVLQSFTAGLEFTVGTDRSSPGGSAAAAGRHTLHAALPGRATYILWSPMSGRGGAKQPYRVQAQRLDFFRQPAVGVD